MALYKKGFKPRMLYCIDCLATTLQMYHCHRILVLYSFGLFFLGSLYAWERTWGSSSAENTHIGGKYHCTAHLLFDWFGLDQTSKTVAE